MESLTESLQEDLAQLQADLKARELALAEAMENTKSELDEKRRSIKRREELKLADEELLRTAEAVSAKLQVELTAKQDAMNELAQKDTANAMQLVSVQKELEQSKLEIAESKQELSRKLGDLNTELQMLKAEKDVHKLLVSHFQSYALTFFSLP